MSKETKIFIAIVIGLLVIIGGLFVASAKTPGKYDAFATCIADSGTKFYGTFWCPHCQAQKALFGKSAKKLPYIECSNSDQSQTQVCKDAGIEGYPTWVFPAPDVVIESAEKPIECVYPYTEDQPLICKDQPVTYLKTFAFVKDKKVITSSKAPTQDGIKWSFVAESRVSGEQSFEALATKTGCALPTN